MNGLHTLLFLVVSLAAALLFYRLWLWQQRSLIGRRPFPAAWEEILYRQLPLYRRLPPPLKNRLRQKIQLFLWDKNFEGCGGQQITDEVRVTIAGQACMLLIGRRGPIYPKLFSILVYPSAFVQGEGLFLEGDPNAIHLGESWQHGTVILAWDSVQRGARNAEDGQNVAIHEFAHQLDQADGEADGAPLLDSRSAYATWAPTFQKEYDRLQKRLEQRRDTFFDAYGATHPAEFFAVVSETFFEKPNQMKEKHPDLYREVRSYYRVDPITWIAPEEEP